MTVMELSELFEAELEFPEASCAAPATTVARTCPLDLILPTVTV